MDKIAAGTTNVSVVFAVKSIYAITAFRGTYTRWSEGGAASAFSAPVSFDITALTALADAHTDNKGIYISSVVTDGSRFLVRVDFPDAAFASGANRLVCSLYDDADEEVAQRIYTLDAEVVDLYGGKIWVDTINGTAGATPGKNGTTDIPVDNIADAMTISAARGIDTLHFAQRSSVSLSADLDGYLLEGSDYIVDLNDKQLDSCVIRGAWISGAFTTVDNENTFRDSILGIISLAGGTRCYECKLTGLTVLNDPSSLYEFHNCAASRYSDTDVVLQYNDEYITVNITNWQGDIGVTNMGAAAYPSFRATGTGTFNEVPTCYEGLVELIGVWKIGYLANLDPIYYSDSGVNLTQINGEDTDGNNATLKLKSLDVQNSAGTAVIIKTTNTDSNAVEINGDGDGAGIYTEGGADGNGLFAKGGSSGGSAIRGIAYGAGSFGFFATAPDYGIGASGYSAGGIGLRLTSGSGGKDIDAKEIDDIKAKTDKLPHSIKKNTAIDYFYFIMLDASTGNPTPGYTVTARRKLDGAASYTTMTGTITDDGDGVYRIAILAADTNGSGGAWKFTAPAAKTTLITFITEEL